MSSLDHANLKHSYTTRAVPLEAMATLAPLSEPPRIGQLVVAEVTSLGKHTTLEGRDGLTGAIFPGDWIVGAFGNRYATDQFEGYVPEEPVERCHMLSIGGVVGQVVSRHESMGSPTRLRVLGLAADRAGAPLSLRAFGLPLPGDRGGGQVILVVGAAMNSGKTTVVGTLARALSRAGFRDAAAKVTGTAAGKDGRFYASSGARPVLDFTDVGYPSTFLLSLPELMTTYRTLLSQLRVTEPDYLIFEIADGIFQRETRMLLETAAFRSSVDHVFFAANDSLSAACGARELGAYGLPLRATSGMVTRSPLATREAEEATGLACLSIERILAGEALALMRGDWATLGAVRERAEDTRSTALARQAV
jgi:hypothetical protein